MFKDEELRKIAIKVEEMEGKYEWLGARKFLEEILAHLIGQEDFLRAGEVQERIGHSLHRAAMQAENHTEYKERLGEATNAFRAASSFYEKSADEKRKARALRSDAAGRYSEAFASSDPKQKRVLFRESLELVGKALSEFSNGRELQEYGKTYNSFPFLFFWPIVYEWDRQNLENILKKGLEWGEKALRILSETNDLREVSETNVTFASCLMFLEAFIEEPEEKEINRLKTVNALSKAIDAAECVGDVNVLAFAHSFLGGLVREEESIRHYEKGIEYGTIIRDSFALAFGHAGLSYMTYWRSMAVEDPDKRIKLAKKAMREYDKGQHYLSIAKQEDPRGVFMRLRARARSPPASWAEHYLQLSMWETGQSKRRKYLEKAGKASEKALKAAEESDMPTAILYFLHVSSRILKSRALTESNTNTKRELLEKALEHREKTINIIEQLAPFDYYAQGVMQSDLGEIKAELANLEKTSDGRIALLEEATARLEKSLALCNKMVPYFERMGDITFFTVLFQYQDTYASLLTQLYTLMGSTEPLRKAIEMHKKAAESARKADLASLEAEAHWNIGKAWDSLGELSEAAQSYEVASQSYIEAAQRTPQLRDFYQEHASYMEAWSEIEHARGHHARREYGDAKGHYEKAAELHKSTSEWNYLSSSYLAWARLEQAEDLSRNEQPEEAKNLFREAATLFEGAENSIELKRGLRSCCEEEELMIARLIKASRVRRHYSLGRMAIEEAKISARQGEPAESSRKYDLAANTFQEAMESAHPTAEREVQEEFLPIINLSHAWHTMQRAEAEVSPELYLEASRLFEKVKELSTDEKARLLALGHSCFCRALEFGARFEATREPALHLEATHQLERAANYYVRAGFKTASEYAMATQRLFDAYVYLDSAKKALDPDKKARFYLVAEKVLQTAIGSFLKAKHPAKSQQAQQLLEKVRAERELAVSLSQVLHAPTITSSTTSFTLPSQGAERSVGLERFGSASIQTKLIIPKRRIRVGEDFSLKMHIGNVGKKAVLLEKVKDVFPKGFEVVATPGKHFSFQDRNLNVKGVQLDPFNTEEINLVLRSFNAGFFEIKPQVTYIGESGERTISKPPPESIELAESRLPNRISTGSDQLDALLFGGVPKNSAVILTAPSSDERDHLIDNFLNAGLAQDEVVFYITTNPHADRLAEKTPNFHVFICNPQAEKIVKDQTNIYRLKGVENLTELNIALASGFRKLPESPHKPRRACLRIVSDVLLEHHAVHTRRWLTSLIPELKSKNFTLLAVMNPQMHPEQEARAVLDLFEGEINIVEMQTDIGTQKHLQIKKMTNQEYLGSILNLQRGGLG
ncbi:MAG: hypothetical protein JSV35_07335 [Candidatus Bathyarchaeota archaeon]|nr:MAG: hypothetical protein JSV35_07335 [Candidatus Bathyarchaeota archaeon]